MMSVLPNQRLSWVFFHIGSICCFFPSSFYIVHIHRQEWSFSRLTNNHSQFETFSNRILKELSRIAFPTIVLLKDDRTDFVQEERPGLRCWTMVLATCASVDVSKYLDIPTLEFSKTSVHPPFWHACEVILRLLLVLRILVVLRKISIEYCIRAWIIFHNVTSESNWTFVFLKLWFQLRILNMTEIHQWRKMHRPALIPCFSDDFRQLPCWYFLKFFPLFSHCCLCIWYFHRLRQRNKICALDCGDLMNSNLFLQCDLHDICEELLSFGFSWVRQLQQYKRILSCVLQ